MRRFFTHTQNDHPHYHTKGTYIYFAPEVSSTIPVILRESIYAFYGSPFLAFRVKICNQISKKEIWNPR